MVSVAWSIRPALWNKCTSQPHRLHQHLCHAGVLSNYPEIALHQHFLLTAKTRTLPVREIFELSDEQAFNPFRELRWGKGDKIVCPACGIVEPHWFLPSGQGSVGAVDRT